MIYFESAHETFLFGNWKIPWRHDSRVSLFADWFSRLTKMRASHAACSLPFLPLCKKIAN